MNKSEQINELAAALAKAQSELEGAKADSENPFFKSKYADLASVWEALRKPLSKNGLSVSQCLEHQEGKTILTSLLMHSSGQFISSSMPVISEKPGPQAMGSAISYARRYSLAALTGVYQADDDAEGAHGRPAPSVVSKPKEVTTPVVPKTKPSLTTFSEADVPMFDSTSPLLDQAKPSIDELRKQVLDVAKVSKWTTNEVKAEIKKREFTSLSEMSQNAINELILFIKGNPNK
jgi:hypothetical protein